MRNLFSLVISVIVLLISCQSKDKHDFTVEDKPLPLIIKDTAKKAFVKDDAVFIDAIKLSADYIANEVKADKDYKGRTLVVTGRIQEITKGIAGDIYVVFTGANKQRVILCEFNHEEKAATLGKNDIISLRGTCDGLMGSILMNNCEMDSTAVTSL